MTDFQALGETKKERMTLQLAPSIKEELKRQAAAAGVSPSAYIAVIVSERKEK